MANYCEKCGKSFWVFPPLVSSKDDKSLCYDCVKRLGLTDDMIDFLRKEGYLSRCSRMTYEESLAYLKEQCNKLRNDTTLTKYNFSYAPCKEIKFDDSNKVFIIPHNNIAKKEYYNSWEYALLKYSQIVSFDLIENGSSIASGGLGRAVVGGLLFGGAGAIVGAVTRSYNELCTDLSIKITVKDYSAPAVYVHLVSSGGIMKNSTQYKEYIKIAQDILSKLQIITNSVDSSTTVPNEPIHAPSSPAFSAADEILKFKKLMDEGIISQEEFDAKKKQLLGIDNTVIISSGTSIVSSGDNNSEYFSVILASYNDCKMAVFKTYLQYKSCNPTEAEEIIDSTPFEIIGTSSKSEAEKVAKMFASAGATVEVKQPKSDGGSILKTFTADGATDEIELTKEEEILFNQKREDEETIAKLKNLKEGDKLFFGSHNGQRLSWKVLKIQDHKALIITEKNVCDMHYNSVGNITWSECTLREWLNNDFYNGDFTQALQERILPSKLNNDNNPKYETPGGVDTTDKVFLLSINEANTLFANDQARANGCRWWWLRSPGDVPYRAAYVGSDGEVNTGGQIAADIGGLRPALRIELTTEKERKEAAEEAKKRFDDYWEAHSDERKKLEMELEELKDQINSLNSSCNNEVAFLEKEIAAIPGKDEIDNLDARIKKLSDDKAALGILKGKEKKALQEQIDQAFADKKRVQDRMDVAKEEIEKRISVVKTESQKKISSLQSRINSIDTELNKAR